MKRILLAFLITFTACNTTQKIDPQPSEKPKFEKVVIRDNSGKQVLELTEEEFKLIFDYSQKYAEFVKLTKDEQTLKKAIEVVKTSDSTYAVKIKINQELMVTATVLINNEELNKLREKMKRLHEAEPNVSQTRISANSFKIDMSIDDVKWSTIIDVSSVKHSFDWTSFWMGAAATALAGLGVAIKAKLALLFFLL